MIIDSFSKALPATEITFCRLDAHITEQELDLRQLTTGLMTQRRTGPSQVVKRHFLKSTHRGHRLYQAPDHLGLKPFAAILLDLLITLKTGPADIPAATSNLSTPVLTQDGSGTVLTWPPLPMRSAIIQCSCRCCRRSPTMSPAQFCPPEPAPKQGGDHGVVAFTADTANV